MYEPVYEQRLKWSHVQGFEQAKGLVLSDEPFSIENDLLTPTLKFKRKEILVSSGEMTSSLVRP